MGKAMTMHDQKPDEEMKQPKAHSYITIDINISRELYHRMRMAADLNNLSLNEYVKRILGETVPDETSLTQRQHHPITREAIERLREIRKKIMQDRGGKPFEEDSAELIREEREKRTRYLMELHGGDDTNIEN